MSTTKKSHKTTLNQPKRAQRKASRENRVTPSQIQPKKPRRRPSFIALQNLRKQHSSLNIPPILPSTIPFSKVLDILQMSITNRTHTHIQTVQLYTSKLKFFKEMYTKQYDDQGIHIKSDEEAYTSDLLMSLGEKDTDSPYNSVYSLNSTEEGEMNLEDPITKVYNTHYNAAKRMCLYTPLPGPGHIVFKYRDVPQNFYMVLKGRVGILIKEKAAVVKKNSQDVLKIQEMLGEYDIGEYKLKRFLNGFPLDDLSEPEEEDFDEFGKYGEVDGDEKEEDSSLDDPDNSLRRKRMRTLSRISKVASIMNTSVSALRRELRGTIGSVEDEKSSQNRKNLKKSHNSKNEEKENSEEKYPNSDGNQDSEDEEEAGSGEEDQIGSEEHGFEKRMVESFAHGLKGIQMYRAVYDNEWIMKNYGGLTIDQLLGGKVNKKTGEKIDREGEYLMEDEEWADPGGLLCKEQDGSVFGELGLIYNKLRAATIVTLPSEEAIEAKIKQLEAIKQGGDHPSRLQTGDSTVFKRQKSQKPAIRVRTHMSSKQSSESIRQTTETFKSPPYIPKELEKTYIGYLNKNSYDAVFRRIQKLEENKKNDFLQKYILTHKDVKFLASTFGIMWQKVNYPRKRVCMKQGELVDKVHILIKGTVKLRFTWKEVIGTRGRIKLHKDITKPHNEAFVEVGVGEMIGEECIFDPDKYKLINLDENGFRVKILEDKKVLNIKQRRERRLAQIKRLKNAKVKKITRKQEIQEFWHKINKFEFSELSYEVFCLTECQFYVCDRRKFISSCLIDFRILSFILQRAAAKKENLAVLKQKVVMKVLRSQFKLELVRKGKFQGGYGKRPGSLDEFKKLYATYSPVGRPEAVNLDHVLLIREEKMRHKREMMGLMSLGVGGSRKSNGKSSERGSARDEAQEMIMKKLDQIMPKISPEKSTRSRNSKHQNKSKTGKKGSQRDEGDQQEVELDSINPQTLSRISKKGRKSKNFSLKKLDLSALNRRNTKRGGLILRADTPESIANYSQYRKTEFDEEDSDTMRLLKQTEKRIQRKKNITRSILKDKIKYKREERERLEQLSLLNPYRVTKERDPDERSIRSIQSEKGFNSKVCRFKKRYYKHIIDFKAEKRPKMNFFEDRVIFGNSKEELRMGLREGLDLVRRRCGADRRRGMRLRDYEKSMNARSVKINKGAGFGFTREGFHQDGYQAGSRAQMKAASYAPAPKNGRNRRNSKNYQNQAKSENLNRRGYKSNNNHQRATNPLTIEDSIEENDLNTAVNLTRQSKAISNLDQFYGEKELIFKRLQPFNATYGLMVPGWNDGPAKIQTKRPEVLRRTATENLFRMIPWRSNASKSQQNGSLSLYKGNTGGLKVRHRSGKARQITEATGVTASFLRELKDEEGPNTARKLNISVDTDSSNFMGWGGFGTVRGLTGGKTEPGSIVVTSQRGQLLANLTSGSRIHFRSVELEMDSNRAHMEEKEGEMDSIKTEGQRKSINGSKDPKNSDSEGKRFKKEKTYFEKMRDAKMKRSNQELILEGGDPLPGQIESKEDSRRERWLRKKRGMVCKKRDDGTGVRFKEIQPDLY